MLAGASLSAVLHNPQRHLLVAVLRLCQRMGKAETHQGSLGSLPRLWRPDTARNPTAQVSDPGPMEQGMGVALGSGTLCCGACAVFGASSSAQRFPSCMHARTHSHTRQCRRRGPLVDIESPECRLLFRGEWPRLACPRTPTSKARLVWARPSAHPHNDTGPQQLGCSHRRQPVWYVPCSIRRVFSSAP